MKLLGSARGVWALVLTLGITLASCAAHKSAGLDKSGKAAEERQELVKTSKEPDSAPKVKVQATYGKLSLHFEPNQGQTDSQVKFLSRGSGYTLFLTPTEAVLALRKPAQQDPGTAGTRRRSPRRNYPRPLTPGDCAAHEARWC